MFKKEVESSNIKSIAYDDSTYILTVEYKSGVKYNYRSIPISLADELAEAPSKGKFMNEHVKGFYDYEKVI